MPPADAAALASTAATLIFDTAGREAIAAHIETGFQARTWTAIAEQIRTEVQRLGARSGNDARPVPVQVAQMGQYHSLARGRAVRLWPGARAGEAFRVGKGWQAPTHEGSWIRSEGGELAIGLAPQHRPLRLGLLLVGSPDGQITWRVSIRHGSRASGILARHGRKWVTQTLPADLGAPGAGPLRIRLQAEHVEPDPSNPDDDEPTVGLAGFFLYPQDDAAARMRLLEAIALGNLDDIDANREPDPAGAPDVAEDWAM